MSIAVQNPIRLDKYVMEPSWSHNAGDYPLATTFEPFSSLMSEIEEQEEAVNDLLPQERGLLLELIAILNQGKTDQRLNETKDQVKRTSDIIDTIGLNVNFRALNGETFLSNAVTHSLDMVKMLLEKVADVNVKDTMNRFTALDRIMEHEEYRDEMSNDLKVMKELLIEHGAKTYKQRMSKIYASSLGGEKLM